MTKTWIALAASLTLVACSKPESSTTKMPPPPSTPRPGAALPGTVPQPTAAAIPDAPAKPAKPDAILVEVNGKKLSESTALIEANRSLAAMNRQRPIPSNSVDQVRQRAVANVMENFVAKTLLTGEAERQGIRATPEEEQQALDRLAKSLPPGKTMEQVLRQGSMTEEQLRQELSDRIRIQKLLSNAVPASASATTEEVDAYIAAHEKELTTPESVHARHILLANGTNNTAEARAERRKTADTLREELIKGADFAEVAQQRSDCPSRTKGGDLGTFTRGRMVPPFEEAAFRQEVGAIGEVVETAFGYHIIQVIEHSPAGQVPREKIVAMLEQQKRGVAMEEWMKGLKAKAAINYSPNAPRMPPRPTGPGGQP